MQVWIYLLIAITGEVFGEVCVGLGEALVGNEPGSALSFTAAKTPGAVPIVKSLPSKPIAHRAPYTTMIARSDSNGEDLEGFAGAGLYDSVTVVPTEEQVVSYADEPLVWDDAMRTRLTAVPGQAARHLQIVTPAEHFINICHEELEALMGPVDTEIRFKRPGEISTIMMVGLQGAGKTTTTGKLARKLLDDGKRPLLVAADIYRPAAIDQLQVLGRQLEIPVYTQAGMAPPELCSLALREARFQNRDVVIFDTAGRLTIDEELMGELSAIRDNTRPDNTFLVLDAMTGQDAVRTAAAFDQRLDLSGVILTKLDGDARGGAALSVKEVTGKPIKFAGTGEKLDAIEAFDPKRVAGRILGMGDVVSLVEKAAETIKADEAEALAKKMAKGQFDLNDLRMQLRQMQNMGGLGIGPMLAGALSEYLPWPLHLTFLVHSAMALLAVCCVWAAPETVSKPARPNKRFFFCNKKRFFSK